MAKDSTTTIIPLAHPFEAEGRTLSEVTIRRAKAKDIRALDARADSSDMDKTFMMIELLTGLPAEVVDEIDAIDFSTIATAVGSFFGGAAAGENGAA